MHAHTYTHTHSQLSGQHVFKQFINFVSGHEKPHHPPKVPGGAKYIIQSPPLNILIHLLVDLVGGDSNLGRIAGYHSAAITQLVHDGL